MSPLLLRAYLISSVHMNLALLVWAVRCVYQSMQEPKLHSLPSFPEAPSAVQSVPNGSEWVACLQDLKKEEVMNANSSGRIDIQCTSPVCGSYTPSGYCDSSTLARFLSIPSSSSVAARFSSPSGTCASFRLPLSGLSPRIPPHATLASLLIRDHSSPASTTRLAASNIQFSVVSPSLTNTDLRTALCGPSLYGPQPGPPKIVVGPPARYIPEVVIDVGCGPDGAAWEEVARGSGSSPTGSPGLSPFSVISARTFDS